MTRILHSVSNLDRGGVETMLMNYYRNIDRTKLQFDFLCNKSAPGAYDKEVRQMGGRIFISPGLNPVNFPKYKRYMRALFAAHPEYKVIHAHNGELAAYALYTAKKAEVPVRILHAHNTSMELNLKMPLKLFCKSRLPKLTTLNYTCGKMAAEFYYGKKAVQSGNYTLVPNAVDTQKFSFSPQVRERLRKQHGLEDKLVLGHVGRFFTQKNHKFLVDIAKALRALCPNFVFVLLGDGELMPSIKKRVTAEGLCEHFVFKGSVPNTHEWYQAFDAFILPSLYEGLPVVGVEAQTAGLACFFSDTITREIHLTDAVQFLPITDACVWAEQILSGVQKHKRSDTRDAIAKAGYDISLAAKKLEQDYLDIVGRL